MIGHGVSSAACTGAPRQTIAGKWDIWRLGTLEAEISRMGGESGPGRITPWDAAFAAGLTVACLLSYEAITVLLGGLVSRGNEFLGGMWAVVATVFVFRDAGAGGLADGWLVLVLFVRFTKGLAPPPVRAENSRTKT